MITHLLAEETIELGGQMTPDQGFVGRDLEHLGKCFGSKCRLVNHQSTVKPGEGQIGWNLAGSTLLIEQ